MQLSAEIPLAQHGKLPRVLVWFRRDLRIEDNHALAMALEVAEEVVSIFSFHPNLWDIFDILGLQLPCIINIISYMSTCRSQCTSTLRKRRASSNQGGVLGGGSPLRSLLSTPIYKP